MTDVAYVRKLNTSVWVFGFEWIRENTDKSDVMYNDTPKTGLYLHVSVSCYL